MTDVTVNIEVWCSCGEGLCNQSTGVTGGVTVEPCQKCLDVEKEKGHEHGYDQGYDQGYTEGERDGYHNGCRQG